MADQLTPEEIEAQKAAEEQAKADAKAEKESKKAGGKENKDAGGIVSHTKHVHAPGKYSLKDLVTFVCKYPEDYKGKRHLKEGTHKIHKLTAERLQTKKLGKIVG